mgnify:CR=1 FL=1
MRIATIYDIHGNLPALEAVLAEIFAEGADRVIVGGDVVAGPLPVETIACLRTASEKIPMDFILGNAESELLRHVNGEPINGLSPRADEEAKWVATQLSAEDIQFIANWPATITLELPQIGSVLFCHATPNDDITVFTAKSNAAKLSSLFAHVSASVVVCGHTHMQFDGIVNNIHVVNSGSVGLPFGQTGADWLLIGDKVDFRHTDYDLEKAAERIRAANYLQAESFAANNVLQAPSVEMAMQMLTQLEASQEN